MDKSVTEITSKCLLDRAASCFPETSTEFDTIVQGASGGVAGSTRESILLDSPRTAPALYTAFVGQWLRDDHTLVDELVRIVISSCSIDWLLHLTRKRYRDHKRHQVLVGLLGWFLLGLEVAPGKTLLEFVRRRLETAVGDSFTEGDVLAAWWTTALLHDHAYPLEHVLKTLDFLEQTKPFGDDANAEGAVASALMAILNPIPGHPLFDTAMLESLFALHDGAQTRAENELKRRLVDRMPRRPCLFRPHLPGTDHHCEDEHCGNRDCPGKMVFRHGPWAAANIMARLDGLIVGNRVDPTRLRISKLVRCATCAIMTHDASPEWRINIWSRPLAWLLVLCDEIQDWDRLLLVQGKSRPMCEGAGVTLDHSQREEFAFRVTYDPSKLTETEWNLAKSQKSKANGLQRLVFRRPEGDDTPLDLCRISCTLELPIEIALSDNAS